MELALDKELATAAAAAVDRATRSSRLVPKINEPANIALSLFRAASQFDRCNAGSWLAH